jgi:hypothetical protein
MAEVNVVDNRCDKRRGRGSRVSGLRAALSSDFLEFGSSGRGEYPRGEGRRSPGVRALVESASVDAEGGVVCEGSSTSGDTGSDELLS